MFEAKTNFKTGSNWSPVLFLSLLIIFLLVYIFQYTAGINRDSQQTIAQAFSDIKAIDASINDATLKFILTASLKKQDQNLNRLKTHFLVLNQESKELADLLSKESNIDFEQSLNALSKATEQTKFKLEAFSAKIRSQKSAYTQKQIGQLILEYQGNHFRDVIAVIEGKYFHYVNTIESQAEKARFVDMIVIIFMLLLMLAVIYRLTKTSRSLDSSTKLIEFQQYALDQHAIVSMSDKHGDFVYVNDNLCEISGYSKDELLQQSDKALQSTDHHSDFYEKIWSTISSGKVWHGEIKNKAKNGDGFWVNATVVPLLNDNNEIIQSISIRTDITQQKNIRIALDEQKNFLNKITDTMAEGVYVQDQQGQCTYLNTAAEKILGWQLDEIRGKSVHDTIHTFDENHEVVAAPDCPILSYINSGEKFESDKEVFVRRDGSVFPVSVSVVPIVENKVTTSSVGVFKDISRRKAFEQEITFSKEAAIEANKAKSSFLANMSHEIRTPMNAIIGMSYLALEEDLEPKQADYIQKVHKSAENLLGIINDILDFSKIEAEKTEIERAFFQLSDVLEEVLNVVSLSARKKGLELIIDIDKSTPNDFFGDALRLRQVLTNLLSNSIKFTEKGEIIIEISVQEHKEAELLLNVAIKDTGIGMNAAQLDKLFKAFHQADASITRKFGGTGLGLVISQNLITLMGGEISVESKEGVGSTFNFYIKLSEAYETQNMSFDYKSIYKKRILIIDDNSNSRDILLGTLSGYGMEIEAIPSAMKALILIEDLYRDKKPTFDLLLLDWKMQEMDGVSFLQQAQYLDAMKATKTIMLTAHSKESLAKELSSLDIEIAGIIPKPVLPQTLLKSILKAFNDESLSSPVKDEEKKSYQQALEKIKGCHVLLVEDHEFNQQVALDLLKLKGVTATVANNGKEALDLLKINEFDGVLMDCQMPVMDGFAATEVLRKQKKFKELPIIAMTANVMPADIERVLAIGMNDHISKPINVENMVLTLAKWISANVKSNGHSIETVKEIQSSIDFSKFKAINANKALSRIDQNEAMYQKLLQSFYQKQQSTLKKINNALKAKNREEALLMIHTLKGITGTIGAEGLYNSLTKFEKVIEEKQTYKPYLLEVVTEFKKVNADLRGIDWRSSAQSDDSKQSNNSAIKEALQSILIKIENFDAESEESIAALMNQVDTEMKQKLEEIKEPVSQFDFSTAEILLISLINSI